MNLQLDYEFIHPTAKTAKPSARKCNAPQHNPSAHSAAMIVSKGSSPVPKRDFHGINVPLDFKFAWNKFLT
jgi:hypothetical protein